MMCAPWAALALVFVTASSAVAGHGVSAPSVPLVATDHVARLLERGEALHVVDLRTPAEFAAGHIPGAVSLPLASFEERVREIPRTRRVLLYCHCPLEEIAQVYAVLFRLGFRNHAVLADGFAGWSARGHPISRLAVPTPGG
jgi:rhodanese-related sulfurtransferase